MAHNLSKHSSRNRNIRLRLQLSIRYLFLVCVTEKIRYLGADQGVAWGKADLHGKSSQTKIWTVTRRKNMDQNSSRRSLLIYTSEDESKDCYRIC